MIATKRIYEEPSESDGYRVLVDRLWPRGIKKETAQIDEWNKAVAPSPELRRWFNHEVGKFVEFRSHYLNELAKSKAAESLKKRSGKVTLLYGAKDIEHNHAVVLKEFLER
jgi:uncharacterized protein YeaO (DUF488 family)